MHNAMPSTYASLFASSSSSETLSVHFHALVQVDHSGLVESGIGYSEGKIRSVNMSLCLNEVYFYVTLLQVMS